MKAAVVAFVLGIVPAALWATGELPPPHARADLVQQLPEPRPTANDEWRQRVGAICGWQRKQVRTLGKAFRKAATPADFKLLLNSAIRLSERSTAIFRRLDAPLTYRREARELVDLLRREHGALEKLADAVNASRAALTRTLRLIARLDSRIARVFVDLDIDRCRDEPVVVPDEDRAPSV